MNSLVITAAKMICKSINALTREVYMLRKDILVGEELDTEVRDIDEGVGQPPSHDRTPYF